MHASGGYCAGVGLTWFMSATRRMASRSRLFRDREFYGGRRFATRARADAYAEGERRLLIDREGWSEPA